MVSARWPIVEAGLDNLVLDTENVRLGIDGLDEAGIASYMVEAEDLLDLARDLLRDGYIDNEVPLVVADGDKYVVMEANRRVAALKAIADPAILGRHSAQLQRTLTRFPDAEMPTTIRVMVAPSREAVQPVLARLHTGCPKRSWIREQQAVFYHARLSDDVTLDDLKAQYPREASKILAFIRMGEMRKLIRGLRYDDPDLEEFVKSSKLAMTSFEYAYERPRIQAALGISFDSQGLLTSTKLSADARRGMMYLLQRFKDGTLNTRSAELKERNPAHPIFVEEELKPVISGEAETTSDTEDEPADSTGASAADDGDDGSNGDGTPPQPSSGDSSANPSDQGTGPAPQPTPRGPNRGDTRSKLDFSGFT